MKLIAFLTAALLLVMSILTSCIIPLNKNFRFKKERVESIEVYDLCQCKNTEGSRFLETESPVYEIPEEALDDFLTDLAEIRFSDCDNEEWKALIGKYLPEEAFQHRHEMPPIL